MGIRRRRLSLPPQTFFFGGASGLLYVIETDSEASLPADSFHAEYFDIQVMEGAELTFKAGSQITGYNDGDKLVQGLYRLWRNNQNTEWFLQSFNGQITNGTTQPSQPAAKQITTVGSIVAYPTYQSPEGFLLCDGSNFDALQYPELYKVLGNVSKLPDLRGQFIRGANNQGNINGFSSEMTQQGCHAIPLLRRWNIITIWQYVYGIGNLNNNRDNAIPLQVMRWIV